VITQLKKYVEENQKNLNYVRSIEPKNDKWIGTLDYAVARFNTLLLRLIQTPLNLDKNYYNIKRCQKIIDNFVKHIRRYQQWPRIIKWYPKICIHIIGVRQIPYIRNLLNNLDE